MHGRESQDTLTDDPLATEIERALAVDPSPEFLARVRTHVATLPDQRRSPWWLGWALASGAVVALGVLSMLPIAGLRIGETHDGPVLQVRHATPGGQVSSPAPLSENATPALPTLAVPAEPARGAREKPSRHSESGAGDVRARTARRVFLPEVILSADEMTAWREYLRMFRDGDFERPIPKLILSRVQEEDLPAIVIPPITLDGADPTEGEGE
jgi:hypothetical protein